LDVWHESQGEATDPFPHNRPLTAAVTGGHYDVLTLLLQKVDSLTPVANHLSSSATKTDLILALETACLLGDIRSMDILLRSTRLRAVVLPLMTKIFTRAGWSGRFEVVQRLRAWLEEVVTVPPPSFSTTTTTSSIGELFDHPPQPAHDEVVRWMMLMAVQGSLYRSSFPLAVRLWWWSAAGEWFDKYANRTDLMSFARIMSTA